ncbi:MAG: GNAT family N-acetyltransferase [Actinomycetota bacterium]
MAGIEVRAGRAEDRGEIYGIHAAAFPSEMEARLVEALLDAGRGVVSLAAEVDGRLVGHVLFSPVTVERNEEASRGVGLAPVAVRPERQGQGVGGALIRAGIEACRSAGFDFVVVLGHTTYYPRFGFERALARGLKNEYGVDEEFMVLELRSGGLDGVGGLVRYAPEFAALG